MNNNLEHNCFCKLLLRNVKPVWYEIIILLTVSAAYFFLLVYYAFHEYSIFSIILQMVWFAVVIYIPTFALLIFIRHTGKKRCTRNRLSNNDLGMRLLIKSSKYLGAFLLIICFVCGFGLATYTDILGASDDPIVSNWFRTPLGDVSSFMIGPNGYIYCGIQFYQRIQVYNSEGVFLRGWSVPASGAFRIWCDDGLVHFLSSRGQLYCQYTSNGKLISSQSIPYNRWNKLWKRFSKKFVVFQDVEYRLENTFMFPRIGKYEHDGFDTTIVSDPWWLWCMMAPFPSLLWGIIGIILLWIGNKVEKSV